MRIQKEKMQLPVVTCEWAAKAFTKGLNSGSPVIGFKLKENLSEFEAITWANVHSQCDSKNRIEDDCWRVIGKTPQEWNEVKVEKSLWHARIGLSGAPRGGPVRRPHPR